MPKQFYILFSVSESQPSIEIKDCASILQEWKSKSKLFLIWFWALLNLQSASTAANFFCNVAFVEVNLVLITNDKGSQRTHVASYQKFLSDRVFFYVR